MLLESLNTLMANWLLVLVSLLAFLVFGQLLQNIAKDFRLNRDPSVIDLELAYKKEPFTTILKSWTKSKGDTAIPAFRRQLWYDNIWAITYAVLLSSFIAVMTIQPEHEPGALLLLLFVLPLLAGFLDIFPENSFYLFMLRGVRSDAQVDRLHPVPILIASIAAIIKLLLLIATIFGLILLLLIMLASSLYIYMNNWLIVAISFLTLLLYARTLFPAASQQYRGKKDPTIAALQLAFTKERFTKVLRAWHESRGSAAIPAFRRSVKRLDYIFPIVYAIFLASAIATLANNSDQIAGQSVLAIYLLPFIAGLFDWIENSLHLRILKGVDNWQEIKAVKPMPILLSSIAASIKWVLVIISFLAIIALLAMRLGLISA